jgi:crotonobetainyl-CoA:carnitine CoA-transferase CaiB-like acyl-CoA transferase
MKALEGLKILDLTRLLPGPFATMYLADFGADVIKIEQPGIGDYARDYLPKKNNVGYRFLMVNRNKKSMTLNLKKEEGKKIFLKLVENADIVIESFRPGIMDKLGLSYKTLSKINPGIIFCSLSGFGQKGSYSKEAGHDLNYISLAGILSLTGKKGDSPVIPGIQIADLTGGLTATIGILIALYSRNLNGKGQYIDSSLFASAVSTLPAESSIYFGSGEIPQRGESRLTGGWPNYGIYKTKDDRYLACGSLEKKFWKNLCKVLEREDLIDSIDNRENWDKLKIFLETTFSKKSLTQWESILEGKDTCVTPVKNIDEVFSDRHVLENELAVEVNNDKFGKHWQLGVPFKLSDTPGTIRTPAPDLGEHTDILLKRLGYNDDKIKKLRNAGVI